MSEQTLSEPDLYLGLLAIRNEFLNLSELKHCLDVRRKIYAKSQQELELGDVLVQQRYLTPQDLEYLRMIEQAEPSAKPVELADVEAEFEQHVAEIKPGSEFAGYHVEEEIGRGGMGVVLRVTQNNAETGQRDQLALKILIGGKDATVRDIERFKKEATVMAPLLHPGIVKIHEVNRHKGLDYIAMEFIEGVSLKELVGEKPLPDDMALMVIRSACEALSFIHSHGIIHRDIKPENLMVRPDGQAVLMDFGLAGWDKIEILAGRGSIGTPMYQPPEQADVGGPFGKISEASDVYGLGATLYYLLTARHPFLGRNVKEVREKIKTQPPDAIASINGKVHPAVDALCLRCLRKRQSERFATPKDLSENIDKVLSLLLTDDPRREKVTARIGRRVLASVRKQDGSGAGRRSAVGRVEGRRSGGGRVAEGRRSGGGKVRGRSPGRTGPKTGTIKAGAAKAGAPPRPRPKRNGATAAEAADSSRMIVIGLIAAVLLGIVVAAGLIVS